VITNIGTSAGVIVMAALLATCAPSGTTIPISTAHYSGTARSATSVYQSGSNAPARSTAKSPASALGEDVNPSHQKLDRLLASALPEDVNPPRPKPEKASALAEDLNLPRQKIELVAPPFVHPHEQVATSGPKIYEVRLVAEEKQMVIDDDGTKLQAMTFNGTIPAPAIVIHEGDYLEVTLASLPSNTMPHNIDFHAATGAQGGGDLTLISPGEQVVFRFKATRAGVFVYHCIPGGPMIPWHIASGMSGVVMVLPRDGLKDGKGKPLHYDRVYYIGEQDFYVPRDEKGKFKTYASHADAFADTLDTMHKLTPSHVVFEGRVNALTGKNALVANVGENVLLIHSQADRESRIHIVGGHGDYVWETGKFSNPPQTDGETWLVRGGSATAVLYRFLQPGIYPYVNHNMTEALELGAFAHIKVEGKWDNNLMSQVKAPAPMMAAQRKAGQ
jgi:nitrite reductase (NO-forming)